MAMVTVSTMSISIIDAHVGNSGITSGSTISKLMKRVAAKVQGVVEL